MGAFHLLAKGIQSFRGGGRGRTIRPDGDLKDTTSTLSTYSLTDSAACRGWTAARTFHMKRDTHVSRPRCEGTQAP
jgi:hypothetical protein